MPSEAEFTQLFEEATKRSSGASKAAAVGDPTQKTPQLDMSQDEQQKFLSAMQNPEFRSLLNEYMAEISDPANRAETEQYLAQLENEQKVPEDKLLVRPVPGFVVKFKWNEDGGGKTAAEMTQKMFVNVCSSDKMQPPSSTPVDDASAGKRGTSWNLPYSVGPERLEKDKGGAMVLTFDVCFHPTTLGFAKTQRTYRDMVVKTCIDAVEGVVRDVRRKPQATLSRDYHVLKGVAYKSGDPVTMCLRKPAAEKKPVTTGKSSNGKAASSTPSTKSSPAKANPVAPQTLKEKPIDVVARKPVDASNEALKLDFEDKDNQKADSAELLKEVSSTKKPLSTTNNESMSRNPPALVTPSLKKIAFKLVYRGKFELLNHMQAEHENVVPVERNRPKELVVEMEFPTLASAAGIDLDVSELALKLTTKGYEPLDLKLPFPVFEAKGSAKFDKKARKLVVTLPVQPPPEPKPKSISLIVEEEDDDDDDADQGLVQVLSQDEPIKVEQPEDTTSIKHHEPKTTAPVMKSKAREDDGFAMLRETAIMVQHDPHYLPRVPPPAQPGVVREAPPAVLIETYDDLPPLESCSEDEGDNDDEDLVLVDSLATSKDEAKTSAAVAGTMGKAEDPHKSAPFTKKETPTCLSFIVGVAAIDAASVLLDFPSTTSFILRFKAPAKDKNTASGKNEMELFELKIESLEHEIEPSQAEYDVASENMVVILTKKQAPGPAPTTTKKSEELTGSPAAPLPTASIAPVVRFQNQLLYELD